MPSTRLLPGADPGRDGQPAPTSVPPGAAGAAAAGGSARHRRRVGRDRRGRGMRGPLGPGSLPLHRSRAERFDELVLDVVERLDGRWEQQLRALEFAVEEVPVEGLPGSAGEPPWLATSWAGSTAGVSGAGVGAGHAGDVALGRLLPATRGLPARIVIYRRPLELRAEDRLELAELVQSVVVEQVAEFLNVTPRDVDPDYDVDDD